jgi:type II secretory pathway pseudopilin PulG
MRRVSLIVIVVVALLAGYAFGQFARAVGRMADPCQRAAAQGVNIPECGDLDK